MGKLWARHKKAGVLTSFKTPEMLYLLLVHAAMFIFLATSAWARIITSDFLSNDNSTGFLLL